MVRLAKYGVALGHDTASNVTYGLLHSSGFVEHFLMLIEKSIAQASHLMFLATVAATFTLTHNWSEVRDIVHSFEFVEVQTGHGVRANSAI